LAEKIVNNFADKRDKRFPFCLSTDRFSLHATPLVQERKKPSFADYFGKYFHSNVKKADESAIVTL
jgi:hypothetical protein